MERAKMVGEAFHPKRRINKKTKLHLVFDPEARKEFLTGFRKRKLGRQKKAQEELKQQIQEERRNLRKEARETYKKLVVSHRAIPELEELISEEHTLENHNVTITELSVSDMAERNNWIGVNKVQYEQPKVEVKSEEDESEVLPGMELKSKKNAQKTQPKIELQSKKDINKIIKKQATKTVQKSRAFQTKGKIEQRKQRKKSSKLKSQRITMRAKSGKGNTKQTKGNKSGRGKARH